MKHNGREMVSGEEMCVKTGKLMRHYSAPQLLIARLVLLSLPQHNLELPQSSTQVVDNFQVSISS